MAIYHLSAKIVSRGKGQSAIAAAAYRSGDPLVDELTGELKSYDKRSLRIIHKEIMAPAHAPEWARDRNALWNAAERAEKRKDAQLAREIEVSLPHELTEQQRLFLVKDFAREQFVRRGYVVDLSIHTPDRGGDMRNHHAHLMISMRVIGPDGFAPMKDRSLNSTEQLDAWRAQWAKLANRHLERHGHAARIDHRSLAAQGIDREATTHVGYAGAEIAARGGQSDRADELTGILERNGLRAQLRAADAELAQLRELVANENRQRRQAPEPERRTRTMLDGPTDDDLKQQPIREARFLAHMQQEHERAEALLSERPQAQGRDDRAKAFLQTKAQEAEDGKKRQAEQEGTDSRDGRNGDISSAAARYSIALGQCYDMRDPYASLARAAGAESAAFHKSQEALRAAAAKETDPDKRQAIELRRRIEGCEYMAITSDRLAGISLAVTGRLDSGQAVKDRQQATDWRARAAAMREERGALLEATQAKVAPARDGQASASASQPTARSDQSPALRSDSQSASAYVPVHPTLPRSAAAPKTAPAPAPAPEPAVRSDQPREPQRGPGSERAPASPVPANDPASRAAQPVPQQPDAPRGAARLEPQPFAAVALKASYAVTMAKSADPAKDAAPRGPDAAPTSERASSPEADRSPTRTHYRSEMPATAPEPQAQNPEPAETGTKDKGKGERAGEAGAMPAPRRGDYRSLPSEVLEPRVTEKDGRDAGTLSEFMKREQPRTSEPRPPVSTGELLRNPALRGDYQRHQQRMHDERQNADKALGRIGSDMEHKRPLQADDLRSLTREQWDGASVKGEAGLSQSVKEMKDRGSQDRGRERTAPARSRWEP